MADAVHAWLPDGWLSDQASRSLLVTDDAGAGWSAYPLPTFMAFGQSGSWSMQLVTPQLGFAVVFKASERQASFYRSTDGGRSFQSLAPTF